jgi:hypothetical protein
MLRRQKENKEEMARKKDALEERSKKNKGSKDKESEEGEHDH